MRTPAALVLGLAASLSACAATPPAPPAGPTQPGADTSSLDPKHADGSIPLALLGFDDPGAIDADVLAKIEQELSTPICGVGYLDTRFGQLEELGSFDKLPYLVRMVETKYTDRPKSYLPSLAIHLMGRLPDRDRPRAWLETFVENPAADATLRLGAARELAHSFKSRAGLDVLVKSLGDPQTQTRADSFSALVPILSPGELHHVVPLAHDDAAYVLGRVVDELQKRPDLAAPFMALVERSYPSLPPDRRGRAAHVLQCLGDTRHEPDLAQYLTQLPATSTDDSLYQITTMCQELALRGHKVGLDGAAAVIAAYANVPARAFFGFAMRQFLDRTTFGPAPTGPSFTDADGQAAIQWWQQNRARLVFDPASREFR